MISIFSLLAVPPIPLV